MNSLLLFGIPRTVLGGSARKGIRVGLYRVGVENLERPGKVDGRNQTVDGLVPKVVAEDEQGALNAFGGGEAGDQLLQVPVAIVNLKKVLDS